MPPLPMRPVSTYLPMRLRGRASGPAARVTAAPGSGDSRRAPTTAWSVELQEEDGDVVLAAAGVGGVDQRVRGLADVARVVRHDARDVVVRQHGGQPVRAEQEDVARLHPV